MDADLVVGASKGNLINEEMVRTMAMRPIVLALSNPDPELPPDMARRVRPDLIYATGRSDLKNQANNALVMPYLFRAALDCEARMFNDEMLLAAAHALATVARENSPQAGTTFGPEYLLPELGDPRLRERIVPAVIEAAIKSGEARGKRKV